MYVSFDGARALTVKLPVAALDVKALLLSLDRIDDVISQEMQDRWVVGGIVFVFAPKMDPILCGGSFGFQELNEQADTVVVLPGFARARRRLVRTKQRMRAETGTWLLKLCTRMLAPSQYAPFVLGPSPPNHARLQRR